jgi:phosphatidylinositol-bisphosphatase
MQELIELKPQSVVKSWVSNPRRRAAFQKRVEFVLESNGLEFRSVTSSGMVGLGVLVYVRAPLVGSFGHIACDKQATGFGGLVGNKGCASVSFCAGGIAFRVLNVHLPSGQGEAAATKRNSHMKRILTTACAPTAAGCVPLFSRRLAGPLVTLVLGDLNSRVIDPASLEHPSEESWLRNDELASGSFDSLRDFKEGTIRFAPTFQYIPGTQKFAWKRHPAWCDRILFKTSRGARLQLMEYDAFQEVLHTSDHRPIAAQFSVASLR